MTITELIAAAHEANRRLDRLDLATRTRAQAYHAYRDASDAELLAHRAWETARDALIAAVPGLSDSEATEWVAS